MRFTKNIINFILILSLATILVVGCGTDDKTEKLTVVRLGSFSVAVDYGPYLIAKNQGLFEKSLKEDNIKVEYTLFQSLAPINESFATDRIDVVFEATPPAIVGKAAGIDIKIADISCSLVQEILVSKESGIKSIAGLKDKKIAVLAGTSSHYGLLKILETEGLNENSIEIVDMIPPDAKSAFETGQVSAWAVWPPWVEQEELSGAGFVLGGGNAEIQSIMAVRGKFAKDYPKILAKLKSVIQQSKTWMIENPEKAQQIISTELNVPLEVIVKAWGRHDWKANLTEEVITDMQDKADFLTKNGFIKTSVKMSDLVL